MDRATSFLFGILVGVGLTLGLQRVLDRDDEDFEELEETIEEHLKKLEKSAQLEPAS